MLENLEDEIDVKAIRKDRKIGRTGLAHGGVAIFYDTTKCTLKPFPLNALRGMDARECEIVTARGNLRGVKREIVLFSCYLPPKMPKNKVDSIFETLTDAISEAKAKANSPWMIIAGDWNKN